MRWPHPGSLQVYTDFCTVSAMTILGGEAVAITEASRRGVSRLVTDAEAGHATVLRRRAVPVAAVVSYQELQRLAALEHDLTDVALVLTRAATDNGHRTALDEVIATFGYSRAELEALDEPV
jgi:hypothetical protein